MAFAASFKPYAGLQAIYFFSLSKGMDTEIRVVIVSELAKLELIV